MPYQSTFLHLDHTHLDHTHLLGADDTDDTNCTQNGGVPWIWNVMHECVEDTQGWASVIVGLVSLILFVVSSCFQIWKNFREGKAAEAVSVWLVVQWFTGDGTNFIGCILTDQLPLQTYTGGWFVFCDVILFIQYVHSAMQLKKRKKLLEEQERAKANASINGSTLLYSAVGLFGISLFGISYFPWQQASNSMTIHKHPAGRTLLMVGHAQPHIFTGTLDEIGYAIGIVSAVFYMGSRIPQLVLNYRRKSCEGLALLMFLTIVGGNVTYGISIIIKSVNGVFILQHLPWIIGSIGMITFDSVMLFQFVRYRNNTPPPLGTSEREALLSSPVLNESLMA